ncbi:MAG: hypothetical protein JWO44_2483 [Bacteroidetes bacterium]|nr:hypothetical protein [Bacteroidota bacterium]
MYAYKQQMVQAFVRSRVVARDDGFEWRSLRTLRLCESYPTLFTNSFHNTSSGGGATITTGSFFTG